MQLSFVAPQKKFCFYSFTTAQLSLLIWAPNNHNLIWAVENVPVTKKLLGVCTINPAVKMNWLKAIQIHILQTTYVPIICSQPTCYIYLHTLYVYIYMVYICIFLLRELEDQAIRFKCSKLLAVLHIKPFNNIIYICREKYKDYRSNKKVVSSTK